MILSGQEDALVRTMGKRLEAETRSLKWYEAEADREKARGSYNGRYDLAITVRHALVESLEATISAIRLAASESAALAACFETIEQADRESARQDAENAERNAHLAKTYETREEAIADGVQTPFEYHCYSCGSSFWAEWRSRYSPSPKCPICFNEDF